tara:strand:+ start:2200 stop:2367 length:168 start_codon:yes stop_codon:yes gene_type:complete
MSCLNCHAPLPAGLIFCDSVCKTMLQEAQEEIACDSAVQPVQAHLFPSEENPSFA